MRIYSLDNQGDSSETDRQQLCHDGDSLISQHNSNGAAFPCPSSTQQMDGWLLENYSSGNLVLHLATQKSKICRDQELPRL